MTAPQRTDYHEYKVIHVTDGGIKAVLLGATGLPMPVIEGELNRWAAEGWQLVFMAIEQRRFALFWDREAAVITLGR
ncbi:DUF4177 domain-containing protein [Spiribacter sp. 2438]|uniref:DUF4177 domain-containing protein n=1 Tax=Spiribacter sp. 2438 TaxID=2666185 RepID=UPI0012B119C8|nr:DUF4177 domain-containing protein [Spiribacter sp. 2438]QGM22443.1 DUF4177 domain-containing protein [Spiribacter sp. 2438]